MNESVAASYELCQSIARRSASSFYYSFLLLPKRKRRAMCALYAYMRRTDDLADNDSLAPQRRSHLNGWRQSLVHAAGGQFDDPILPALADTMASFDIPWDYLHTVIDGVEMDVAGCRYETFEDLEVYCYRVAAVVGLACLKIWGCEEPLAQWPARQCGLAFQLTNILRDLKDDAAQGRIYLPSEDLARFGYTAEDLRSGVRDERFARLMQFEIERNEQLYAEGADLDRWLEPQMRRVFGSMVAVYRALLSEIKRLDGDVLSSRVRLSKWRKMRIATRWLLFAPGLPRPVGASAP